MSKPEYLYRSSLHTNSDLGILDEDAALNVRSPFLPSGVIVQYADGLSCLGEVESGWRQFERAIDLNPIVPDHYWWAGASILLQRGDYSGAIELCGRMESETPAVRLLAACHALSGNEQKPKEYGRRVKEIYPKMDAAAAGRIVPYRDEHFRKLLEKRLRLAEI